VVRTIINLDEEDKRRMDRLLQLTSGIWKKGDGLAYQRRMREEWETPR